MVSRRFLCSPTRFSTSGPPVPLPQVLIHSEGVRRTHEVYKIPSRRPTQFPSVVGIPWTEPRRPNKRLLLFAQGKVRPERGVEMEWVGSWRWKGPTSRVLLELGNFYLLCVYSGLPLRIVLKSLWERPRGKSDSTLGPIRWLEDTLQLSNKMKRFAVKEVHFSSLSSGINYTPTLPL